MNDDKEKEQVYIDTKVLKESTLLKHFDEFEQEFIERCPDCGSSLFRIYNEPVKEGQYEQMVCATCNHMIGGWLNDFKTQIDKGMNRGVAGKICRKCGSELER